MLGSLASARPSRGYDWSDRYPLIVEAAMRLRRCLSLARGQRCTRSKETRVTQAGRVTSMGEQNALQALGIGPSIGRIEDFPDGIGDRARSNDRSLGHDEADNVVCRIDPKLGSIEPAPPIATGGKTGFCGGRSGHYPKAQREAPPRAAKRRHIAGRVLRHLPDR